MPINLNVKNAQGVETGAVAEIQDSWMESVKGEQAVKDCVVAFMAALRSGTACTKNRASMSSRTQAKPYRQKGTGRARAGGASSPIWTGGAVAFGPVPRDYAKNVNKKVQKLALKRAFTDRLNEGAVVCVEDFDFATPKTKEMTGFMKHMGCGRNALVLVSDYTDNVELASRNLRNCLVLKASSVNPYMLLYYSKIVITVKGLEALSKRLA